MLKCVLIAAWAVFVGGVGCVDMKGEVERTCPERNTNYKPDSLKDAKRFLKMHNCRYRHWMHYSQSSMLTYQTDLTEKNRKALLKMRDEIAEFLKETAKRANEFEWKKFQGKNETIFKWFRALSQSGPGEVSLEKSQELNKVKSDMEVAYSKTKICAYRSKKKCNLGLETDLAKLMYTSRDYEELLYLWKEFRDASGKPLKKKFLQYVKLSNEAAKESHFKDYAEQLKAQEAVKGMEDELERLWNQVKPLFKQIHAYTRRKLIQHYGPKYIRADGPIPAHLLGHMFSQTWAQIFDILNPFPKSPSPDITQELVRRKMKPIEMFKIAEEFFISIGMPKMTKDFWQKSVIEKPKDKEMVCHPSAWTLYNGRDYRIKMCTQVNMKEFVTVHHEMGHIEYFQLYSHLPVVFQEGANPGFHEAVGDTMALSVATPTHLKKIKLLKNFPNNTNSDIMFLLRLALEKVVYVPSSYIYDLWRWKVLSGEIPQSQMNSKWWQMRNEYEGLCPPIKRTEDDLDPLSKYHVATDMSYIRYFWGFLLQFQFHKALCREAGHRGPMHTCDIYQNKKAGELFSKMLRLGKSEPWQEALAVITKGEYNKLSAQPLLEYFEPLHKWLKEQNRDEFIGWKTTDPTVCPKGTERSRKGKVPESSGEEEELDAEDTDDEPVYIEANIEDDDDQTGE